MSAINFPSEGLNTGYIYPDSNGISWIYDEPTNSWSKLFKGWSFALDSSDNTQYNLYYTEGKVGIGTNNPKEKLEVTGGSIGLRLKDTDPNSSEPFSTNLSGEILNVKGGDPNGVNFNSIQLYADNTSAYGRKDLVFKLHTTDDYADPVEMVRFRHSGNSLFSQGLDVGPVDTSHALLGPNESGLAINFRVQGKVYARDGIHIMDRRNSPLHSSPGPGDIYPTDWPSKSISTFFTNQIAGSSVIWDSGITVKGWGDGRDSNGDLTSTYRVWQLFSNSTDSMNTTGESANNDNLYFRSGTGETWGNLQKVWTDGNLDPVSITGKWSDGTTSGDIHYSSGKVGIGTVSPDSLLEVQKNNKIAYDETADDGQRDGTATLSISNQDGDLNTFSQILFDTAATNQAIARIAAIRTGTSSNDLAFALEHGNTKHEAMRITSTGKVGIGNTNPFATLEVNTKTIDGSIRIGNWEDVNQTNRYGKGTSIEFISDGDPHFAETNSPVIAASIKALYDKLDNDTDTFKSKNTALSFSTIFGKSGVTADLTEKMRISSDGKVGIGTTNPEEKLHVNGYARLGDWISKKSFYHDKNYGEDNYIILIEYDTNSFASGKVEGFRNGDTAMRREVIFDFSCNSTAWPETPTDTEGSIFVRMGAMLSGIDMEGFYSLEYDGKKYLTIKVPRTSHYHALSWNFQGRHSGTDDNFFTLVGYSELSEAEKGSITLVEDYIQLDNYLYRKGGNIGIGTDDPSQSLHVLNSNGAAYAFLDSYRTNQFGGGIMINHARGTETTPSQLLQDDYLGLLSFGSFLSSTFTRCAEINAIATQNHSATAGGTKLVLQTTANDTIIKQDRLIINHDGNVGIGTGSPDTNLSVCQGGDVKAGRGGMVNFHGPWSGTETTSFAYIKGYKESETSGENGGRLALGVRTNAADYPTERLVIDSTGNVHIGTSSTSVDLKVNNNTVWHEGNFVPDSSIVFSSSILDPNTTPEEKWVSFTIPYSVGTGHSHYYYFDVYGYSDIGTMDSQLHYRVYIHVRSANTSKNMLNVKPLLIMDDPLGGSDEKGFEFYYTQTDNTDSKIWIKMPEDYSGLDILTHRLTSGFISTVTSNMFAETDTAPSGTTEIPIIESLRTEGTTTYIKGNVGIGTSAPSGVYKLSVENTSGGSIGILSKTSDANSAALKVENSAGSTNLFEYQNKFTVRKNSIDAIVVDSSGKVGIGTTPLYELHVKKDQNSSTNFAIQNHNVHADAVAQMFVETKSGGGDPQIHFQIDGVESYTVGIDNSDSDKFKISDYGSLGTNDRLVIDSSGRVGIGTNAPAEKLDVTGVIRAGNNTSTGGGTALRVRYQSAGDHTANFGAAISSGAPMIGYCVESSQNPGEIDTFVSTADNSDFHRGALVVSNELEFWSALGDENNIPTVGDVVTMTKNLFLDSSGNLSITGDINLDTTNQKITFGQTSNNKAYIQNIGGQIRIGSDDRIEIYETDTDSLSMCLTANDKSIDFQNWNYNGTSKWSNTSGTSRTLRFGEYNDNSAGYFGPDANTNSDGKIDLGASDGRFRDGHFSGTVSSGVLREGGTALSSKYLPLSGGTITGVIDTGSSFTSAYRFDGRSFSWHSAMQYPTTHIPHIMQQTYSGWDPIMGIKTTNGFWQFGAYSNDTLHLGYMSGAFGSHSVNSFDKSLSIAPIGSPTVTSLALTFGGYINAVDGLKENGTALSDKYAPINATGKWSDGTTSGDIHYSSGKVGIGTTNPSHDLEVVTDTGIKIKSKTNDSDGAQIFFSSHVPATGVTEQYGWIKYNHTDGSVMDISTTDGDQYKSGDGFIIGGSEADTAVNIQGHLLVDERLEVYGDVKTNKNLTVSGVTEYFRTYVGRGPSVSLSINLGLEGEGQIARLNYLKDVTGDFTVNITHLGGLSTWDEATNISIVVEQGSTAYIPNVFQIGGYTKPVKWQGGSIPTGTPNGIDIFSFTLIYNNVLGNMVSFS